MRAPRREDLEQHRRRHASDRTVRHWSARKTRAPTSPTLSVDEPIDEIRGGLRYARRQPDTDDQRRRTMTIPSVTYRSDLAAIRSVVSRICEETARLMRFRFCGRAPASPAGAARRRRRARRRSHHARLRPTRDGGVVGTEAAARHGHPANDGRGDRDRRTRQAAATAIQAAVRVNRVRASGTPPSSTSRNGSAIAIGAISGCGTSETRRSASRTRSHARSSKHPATMKIAPSTRRTRRTSALTTFGVIAACRCGHLDLAHQRALRRRNRLHVGALDLGALLEPSIVSATHVATIAGS
jgi:hypothetical protein